MDSRSRKDGFTLIELLTVVAIIAILMMVIVLKLNPAQLYAQAADVNRLSDIATLNSALGLYSADQSGKSGFSLGSSSVAYISVPDTSPTCANLGLPALPTGYSYACAPSTSSRNTNGAGWIPVNFGAITTGSPFESIPTDPSNQTSSDLFYTYSTDGTNYEVTAVLESSKYRPQLIAKHAIHDYPGVVAQGSSLAISPLFNPSGFYGYWPLNEGTGGSALDESGSKNKGTWNGGVAGTSGYYSPGNEGVWAGTFDGGTTYVSTANAFSGPTVFSIVVWFKTTSGSGGKLVGFGGSQTGSSGSYDRHIYMMNDGQLIFGNWTGSAQINTSPSSYNDGKWHFVVGTLSSAGQYLYVDGSLVASSSNTGTSAYNGYWRIGYDNLNGWPSAPSSYYFGGLIQGVRIYSRALSPAEVLAIYNAEK